jgi:hypothetical protein
VQPNSDRPLGITIIAALDFLSALIMLSVSAAMAKGIELGLPQGIGIELARRAPFLALLAFLPAALGLGLWYLQNWARMITLAFSVLGFSSGAYRMITASVIVAFLYRPGLGNPAILFYILLFRMLVSAALTIYLLRSSVARAFQEAW